MRYRVHKHCRRPECRNWVVSGTDHVQVHETGTWKLALDWTLARVQREALTRRDGWIDQAQWDAAVDPTLGLGEIRVGGQPLGLFQQVITDYEAPVVAKAQERAESYTDVFSQLAAKALGAHLPEGFADLAARARIIWPEPQWQAGDPLVNAQVAGYVGEFATDECENPAKNDDFELWQPENGRSAVISPCNDVAENPKIVDTQQISDSGA
jgi:hypothetical protein